MEIRQLKQFIAVAQAHSFSRAAQTLFMAQPPLSIAIKKLEEEVGVALFKRTHRGVELTSAGDAALAAAIKCVKEADNVVQLARAANNGETGVLRVGFIGSLNFSLLPSLIKDFLQEYPGVHLHLQESTNEGLLAMVESETIDLAFVRSPTRVPSNCSTHLIAKDVFCAALPEQHPLTRLPRITLEDFRHYPFIGYTHSRVGGLGAVVQRLFQDAGFYPDVVQEAVQVQTVVGLVRSGLGISLIPSANAPFMPQDVVFKKLHRQSGKEHIGISITHLKTNQNPALVKLVKKLTEQASLPTKPGGKGAGVAGHSAL